MKKFIFLLIFLFSAFLCSAQSYKFQTEALAISLYSHVNEDFEEWKEWKPCQVIVTLQLDSATIYIDSEKEQMYRIADYEMVMIEDTKSIIFYCIDPLDGACLIQLVYLSNIDKHHLYIIWKELKIVYQMRIYEQK